VGAGEGGVNGAYAGALGVPVVLAAGDSAFVAQFGANVPTAERVVTKVAVTPASARLRHPDAVRADLAAATRRALQRLDRARPFNVGSPVRVRLRLSDVTRPQILEAIPGVRQVDGYTVECTADSMGRAYRLNRLMSLSGS